MRLLRPFLAASIAALVGGCALKAPQAGDELARASAPSRVVPEKWIAQGATAGAVGDRWLASFGDPQLDALVSEAVTYNYDLRIAAARVEQSAAYQKIASATLYPQVNVLARGGGKLSGDSSGLQGAGVFVNWELDLWGRVRAGAAAADAQYVSVALDAEYARQSIAAQVAKGWFLATEALQQRNLADETVSAATRLTSLALDRQRVGVGDEYDVRVSLANLETFRDAAQNLDLSYQQALRSLEVVVGRYPSGTLAVPTAFTAVAGAVPGGMPSELLERRPDIVAAERRVAAAFYRGEEAKAAQLPKISLTGAVSSITSELFVLQDRDNPVWSAGASLLAPIYMGGQLRAQVAVRTAEQKQALAEYGRAGARAFGEVENALSAGFALEAREAILQQAVSENERALELANIRYRVGSGDLRAVMQQNLALYAARVSLIRVRSERLAQRVNLYLALGGSFDERPADTQTGQATQAAGK